MKAVKREYRIIAIRSYSRPVVVYYPEDWTGPKLTVQEWEAAQREELRKAVEEEGFEIMSTETKREAVNVSLEIYHLVRDKEEESEDG